MDLVFMFSSSLINDFCHFDFHRGFSSFQMTDFTQVLCYLVTL